MNNSKFAEGGLKELKIRKSEKPKFMFAVVWQDEVGQNIHLFKRKSQAEDFYNQIK